MGGGRSRLPRPTRVSEALRPGSSLPFHNRDVAVDGEFRKTLYTLARPRPGDLQPIHLFGLAQTQNLPRVVARQKASTRVFQTVVDASARAPFQDRPDRGRIEMERSEEHTSELQSQSHISYA